MKSLKCICRGWLAGLGFLLLAPSVLAHDPRPVTVTISESLPEIFVYGIRVPDILSQSNSPILVWPDDCLSLQGNEQLQSQQGLYGAGVHCPGGLEGRELSLAYPEYNPSLGTFYRLRSLDGSTQTAMISPAMEVWTVPVQPTSGTVALQYLLLGIEHILGGLDHLLFVLGLLVIAATTRRILWTITGFTLAHSITLTLSSLGLITLPIPPIEACIALSILFLAVEIGQKNRQDTLTYRYPLIVAFVFGLLHGLGFASALGEIGLVPGEIFLSLLSFNIGVELGQIFFILAVVLALASFQRLVKTVALPFTKSLANWSDNLAMYIVGIPSAYWVIDRTSFLYS